MQYRRRAHSDAYRRQLIVAQLFEQRFDLASRDSGKRFRNQTHTDQKRAYTLEQT